jgi:DNA-binding NarL/FixJ family response regulator
MKPPIRVLIVDDHAMVRFALSEAIQRHSDLNLAGEAENGAGAVSLYRKLRPDVVTMDFKLPDRDGDEVVSEIRAEFPGARVVMLSIFENSETIWRATEAGVLGYVTKAAKVVEVIKAIRSVALGKPYFTEGLAEKLTLRRQQENLTARELAVLELVAAGRSNKEIMAALHISLSTVKLHLQNIFGKLGAQDRTQATALAFQRGIVRLEES